MGNLKDVIITEEQKEELNIKKMNIFEKLLKITDEVGVVGKNLKVQVTKTNSYQAVSERDILDSVKPIESKYRVYSYPYERQIIDKDTLVKESEYNGNVTRTNQLFMRLETIYRFVNIDNPTEFIDIKTYGDGLDTGDKATGKAMTYADKYALMKAYKISTGDDPDKEPSPQNGYDKKEFKKNNMLEQADDEINLALTKEFNDVLVSSGTDLDELLTYYNKEKKENFTINDLTEQQKKEAIVIMKRKGAK